jgi:hypothetical protein
MPNLSDNLPVCRFCIPTVPRQRQYITPNLTERRNPAPKPDGYVVDSTTTAKCTETRPCPDDVRKRTLVGVTESSATRAHESSRRALCGTMASILGINGSERRSETKWKGRSMARLPEEDVGVVLSSFQLAVCSIFVTFGHLVNSDDGPKTPLSELYYIKVG